MLRKMLRMPKRPLSALLFTGVLICFGYVAAQQSGRSQSDKPQAQNDQLAQLQMQVKDLQAAIDNLKSEQQVIVTTVKETRGLELDTSVAQKQDRADLDALAKAVDRNDRGIDRLGRQLDGIMRDLQRVKTKVGLF